MNNRIIDMKSLRSLAVKKRIQYARLRKEQKEFEEAERLARSQRTAEEAERALRDSVIGHVEGAVILLLDAVNHGAEEAVVNHLDKEHWWFEGERNALGDVHIAAQHERSENLHDRPSSKTTTPVRLVLTLLPHLVYDGLRARGVDCEVVVKTTVWDSETSDAEGRGTGNWFTHSSQSAHIVVRL